MSNTKISDVLPVAEAACIWRLYGFTSPSELVLEDIALANGVIVVDGRLDSADARLIRKGKHGLIRIREDIPEVGRKRFAIAHELGHWLLHAKVSQVLACTDEDMRAKYKGSVPEIEANFFAAELLMPTKLFSPQVRDARLSMQLVKRLAAEFQTTLTATAMRTVDLSDDYCAIIVSEDNRVRWWHGSPRFNDVCWIETRAELSLESVAGMIFGGQDVPSGPQEIDATAWLGESERLERDTMFEDVVAAGRYGQVISLIWLS